MIIENTDRFTVESHGNGAAYTITDKITGESKYVQYGDDAAQFRSELDSIETAHADPRSAWHRRSWNSCLAYLFEIA